MYKRMQNNSVQQAYCLEKMGIVHWLPKSSVANVAVLSRPISPWSTDSNQSFNLDKKADSVARAGFGFRAPAVLSKDPEVTQKTVAGLKEELLTNSSVIVEDLQPIEEYAVEIAPLSVFDEKLSHDFSVQLYVVEKRLLLLTQVPRAFDAFNKIERLALKMSQALLKQTTDEWVSSKFSWPDKLTNPYFVDRTDWMLSALDSFIERYLEDVESPIFIVAGSQIQQIVSALPVDSKIVSLPRANIVSLPELYRIPELKRDAWMEMQKVMQV